MNLLHYILIPTVVFLVSCRGEDRNSLFPTYRGCKHEIVECVSKAYCNEVLHLGWTANSLTGLRCPNTYIYEGERVGEVYYAFKNYDSNEDPIMMQGTYAAHIVNILDLSYNNYKTAPTITSMERIKLLNMSRNELIEAKLYNEYELGQLSEIDLSHNKIVAIDVKRNQHVFRWLKIINLSNNDLVILEDGIFDSFPLLEDLDLSFNYIETINILTFEGVRNLLKLNMKHNELLRLDSSLIRFTKLEELNLSNNKIENIKLTDFEKFTKLQILDLSSNWITTIDDFVFSSMSSLRVLNLSENLLYQFDDDTFANLTALVNLNLSENNLKSLPKDLFKDKHISQFTVSDNKLEGKLENSTFKGLKLCDNFDLSNQKITSIEDLAFEGLDCLKILLLNGNRLETISKKAFSTLRSLEVLDLSNNQLTNMIFDTNDFSNLRSLSFRKNFLIEVKHDPFIGLNRLEFIDLSYNNISQIEIDSFKSLKNVINFQISNNPITDLLEKGIVEGFKALPSLDISNMLLASIKNESFIGMNQLKELNASHCKISDLQYNSFKLTGSIETIDLSFNQLSDFKVNTTHLANLRTLILNNNLLTKISIHCFKGLPLLTKLLIYHNEIENIDDKAFKDQKEVEYIDVSYNPLNNVSFKSETEIKLFHLKLSHSNICNITAVGLQKFKSLDNLVLNNNNITKVEATAFQGIQNLKDLDLSFNKISFLQPGAFKDNTLLRSLNVSHNMLSAVHYGIFRGLLYLEIIDISYNEITDLQSERFYEVTSLTELIADHNQINNLNEDEFLGTKLVKLSIGENPIPCHVLVNIMKVKPRFAITAIKLDESSDDENINGVTCNVDRSVVEEGRGKYSLNKNILTEIKNILHNISRNANQIDAVNTNINASSYNHTLLIEKLSSEFIQSNQNHSLLMTTTNLLLDKVLNTLNSLAVKQIETSPIPPKSNDNAATNNLISYINKMKKDLENSIIIEMEKRTPIPYPNKTNSDLALFIFLDVCVAVFLVILVIFILYKFCSSKLVRKRSSISTRQLSDVLENSVL